MTLLKYKGYTATLEVDVEDGVLRGDVIDIRDVITFEGNTIAELEQAFHESIDDYLDFCARKNIAPEKPFSGQFLVRTTPERHRLVAEAAAGVGKSVNKWVDDMLQQALESKVGQSKDNVCFVPWKHDEHGHAKTIHLDLESFRAWVDGSNKDKVTLSPMLVNELRALTEQ